MAKTLNTGMISAKINGITVNTSLICNSGNYQNKASRNVIYIVMHYTGNKKDTAKNNATYFKNNDVNVSAHFFTDDSNIYQSAELRDIAWHCGTDGKYYHSKCRNANSIGIEMCCTAGNYKISEKTKENSAYLCAYLCEMLNIKAEEVDTYVLRHYDVTHKECPAQMVKNASEWTEFKNKVKTILNKETVIAGDVDGDGKVTAADARLALRASVGSEKLTEQQKAAADVDGDGKVTAADSREILRMATGQTTQTPYLVKVTADSLNIRKGAGTKYAITGVITNKGVYTIVEEKDGWGKLKSGAGWISLKYTKRV